MVTRDKGYDDYKITKEQVIYIKSYCRSKEADRNLIMNCCKRTVNDTLAEYLYHSLVYKKSWEQLWGCPIGKNDFYGWKRKAIWEIKKELFK